MAFNKDIHHRKSIRLRGYDYSRAGAYFITIYTHQRQPLFGNVVNGGTMLNVADVVVEKSRHPQMNRFVDGQCCYQN